MEKVKRIEEESVGFCLNMPFSFSNFILKKQVRFSFITYDLDMVSNEYRFQNINLIYIV